MNKILKGISRAISGFLVVLIIEVIVYLVKKRNA